MTAESATPSHEFHELASRFLDGDLSAAEESRFCGMLESQPGLRAEFARLMNLHGTLRMLHTGAQSALTALNESRSYRVESRLRRVSTWRNGAMAACAVATVAALLFIWRSTSVQPSSPTQPQPQPIASVLVDVIAVNGALQLSAGQTAEWHDVTATIDLNAPMKWNTGARLRFASKPGVVTLADGTVLNLREGTELTFSNSAPLTVELNEGEAFFQVPHSMQQTGNRPVRFLVRTPDADVRVTGTAFGVIRHRQQTDVAVEQGQIEFANTFGKVAVAGGERSVAKNGQGPAAAVSADISVAFAWRNEPTDLTASLNPNWARLNGSGLPRREITALLCRRKGELYAAVSASGICMSSDDGKTWKDISGDNPGALLYATTLALTSDGDLVAACAFKNVDHAGIPCMVRDHMTQRWTASTFDQDKPTQTPPLVTSLCADANGAIIATIDSTTLWKSLDGGLHFKYLGRPYASACTRVVCSPLPEQANRVLAATEYYGFFESGDGGLNWKVIPPAVAGKEFDTCYAACFAKNGDVLLARLRANGGDTHTLWRYAPPQPVTPVELPDSCSVRMLVSDVRGSMLCVSDRGQLYQSIDDGVTWTTVQGLPGVITHVAFDADGRAYTGTKNGALFVRTSVSEKK